MEQVSPEQGNTEPGPLDPANERDASALLTRAAWLQALALAVGWPAAGHAASVCKALERVPRRNEPTLDTALAATLAAWRAAEEERLQYSYIRLFSGTGPCPPHETSYGDARRLGGPETELADISGFYAAFGIEVTGPMADLPDHLASELEFQSSLLVKAAYARVNGWPERQRIAQQAARDFCEHHLGRWVGAFREAVEAAEAMTPYLETARLIEAALQHECARLGANPSAVHGRVPVSSAEALSCARAEEPPAP